MTSLKEMENPGEGLRGKTEFSLGSVVFERLMGLGQISQDSPMYHSVVREGH